MCLPAARSSSRRPWRRRPPPRTSGGEHAVAVPRGPRRHRVPAAALIRSNLEWHPLRRRRGHRRHSRARRTASLHRAPGSRAAFAGSSCHPSASTRWPAMTPKPRWPRRSRHPRRAESHLRLPLGWRGPPAPRPPGPVDSPPLRICPETAPGVARPAERLEARRTSRLAGPCFGQRFGLRRRPCSATAALWQGAETAGRAPLRTILQAAPAEGKARRARRASPRARARARTKARASRKEGSKFSDSSHFYGPCRT